MDEKWIKTYDDLAKNHKDAISQSGYMYEGQPIPEKVFDDWFEQIQKHFKVTDKSKLVDIGCGSGIFLKKFYGITKSVYGVDTSENQILAAEKNCPGAVLKKGDALNFAFPDVVFDRLFCNSVFLLFSGLDYAKGVIKNFLEVSAPDAKIWLGDIPYPTPEMKGGDYRRKTKAVGFEMQHYPVEFLLDVCSEFQVKGTEIKQNVEGKISSQYRYDFLIEK